MILATEGLIEELRQIGLPISVSEKLDAAAVLKVVDLADREAVKSGLGAVLVKNSEHQSAYDAVFDLYFARRAAEAEREQGADGDGGDGADGDGAEDGDGGQAAGGFGDGGGGGLDSLDDASIRQLLIETLEQGDESSLLQRNLAQLLVARHAAIQPGRAVAGTYYLFRTMRAVNPEGVVVELVQRAEQKASGQPSPDAHGPSGPAGKPDPLSRRLLVEEYERRMAAFQQTIESEIRRRLVADRGVDAVAKTLRRPLPEDIDFLTAANAQLVGMREIVQPLTRKLAARLQDKRKHSTRGTVNFRKTMRTSLSTGGVPLELQYHAPRPTKPELVVLADISGSVSAFAAFTLQLAYALRSEFARVRGFVFIDGVDEVTDLLSGANDVLAVTTEINRRGLGVWLDGRSDYGNALDTFWSKHGQDLKQRTTVLVLGDSRTNYHAPRADILAKISQRAGHLFWLNPEPRPAWDSGDSVVGQYARYCDAVVECRNLRQLRTFIEQLD
ncbi:MAG: domain containing CoxE-like protein [Frankiales bacterium]|nr:domain containing CoxE-like protein [Frankiales bacterium]